MGRWFGVGVGERRGNKKISWGRKWELVINSGWHMQYKVSLLKQDCNHSKMKTDSTSGGSYKGLTEHRNIKVQAEINPKAYIATACYADLVWPFQWPEFRTIQNAVSTYQTVFFSSLQRKSFNFYGSWSSSQNSFALRFLLNGRFLDLKRNSIPYLHCIASSEVTVHLPVLGSVQNLNNFEWPLLLKSIRVLFIFLKPLWLWHLEAN